VEATRYDGPCLTSDSLWNALNQTYNSTQDRQVHPEIIEELENPDIGSRGKRARVELSLSLKELREAAPET
jgi:hypothetical protein